MKLLNKVPSQCGINTPVLQILEAFVKKMEERHLSCILMFDEIDLEPTVTNAKKKKSVEGFVN